jgi:hypothetical protein
MTRETIERAHALATKYPGMSAAARLRVARGGASAPAWIDTLATDGHVERDGFELVLSITPDDYPDVSFLGEFTDRQEPGAVPNPEGRYDSRLYRWFVPAITEDEHYRGLRDLKFGRAQARDLARSYVRQDLELARDYAPVIATVTAHRAGVELGSASLGGIDDEDYARSWDVLGDLASEALAEAQETLGRLCRSDV